jgi:hypothetical protein
MGTLGRHKRRRRNTHEHVCRNETGQIGGEDPSLQQDGDSSSLANVPANQPQEQEGTQMPDCAGRERSFSAPQKEYPNKKSMNTDPSVGTSSTVQKKVLAKCTEAEILGFLAVLQCGNGKTVEATETVEKSTPPVPLHYSNQYLECEKLSEFSLDFDSFAYRMNKFESRFKGSHSAGGMPSYEKNSHSNYGSWR